MTEIAATEPCRVSEGVSCNFSREEQNHLRTLVTNKEYIGFPRWAMGALITLLFAMGASHVALWVAFSTRSNAEDTSAQIVDVRDRLTKMETAMPDSFPPKWFLDQFETLHDQVLENNKILTDLRIEVRSLTSGKGRTPDGI